jgi:hypothetical protein
MSRKKITVLVAYLNGERKDPGETLTMGLAVK